jgi:hypothetical protein
LKQHLTQKIVPTLGIKRKLVGQLGHIANASEGSVCGSAVIGCASYTIASTLTAAVVTKLALFEFTGVGAVAFLLFTLEVSALGHEVLGGSLLIQA